MAMRRLRRYGAFGTSVVVGIETILVVLGVAVVIAIVAGVSRARRKAGGAEAPKPATPSTVRKKP